MILKGESAEEFNRKADENYEKYKARQKQNLIDMMESDEKLGLYQEPTTPQTVEECNHDWMERCKQGCEYIECLKCRETYFKNNYIKGATDNELREAAEEMYQYMTEYPRLPSIPEKNWNYWIKKFAPFMNSKKH